MPKYLILDRDGTINRDTVGYTYRIEDMDILPGVIKGLLKFKDAGFKFIVVTNQAGIARKLYSLDDMHNFHLELQRRLVHHGITVDKIYFCPHHPQITGECSCRKPKTGMIELAKKELGLETETSIVMGDRDYDIELGKNCGALTVLIESDQYSSNINPDFRAKNIDLAFGLLRSSGVL